MHHLLGSIILSVPCAAIEKLRNQLVSMKKGCASEEAFKTCISTVLKYLGNVVRAPDEDKFRSINLGNAAFQSRVAAVQGAVDFLQLVGFQVRQWGSIARSMIVRGACSICMQAGKDPAVYELCAVVLHESTAATLQFYADVWPCQPIAGQPPAQAGPSCWESDASSGCHHRACHSTHVVEY